MAYMNGLEIQKNKIAVIGFGVSGRSISRYFLKNNVQVDMFEDKKSIDFDQEALNQFISSTNFKIYFNDSSFEPDITQYDYVIVSPGVHDDHKIILLAQKENIEYITDINAFSRIFRSKYPHGKLISVTGSNGKSTTVSMLCHVLKSTKLDVYLGGNIGTSPLDFLGNFKTDTPIVILETSSYQLEYLKEQDYFDIACILNLSDNHLDRYHGKVELYARAKMGGIDQVKTDVFVNYDDDYTKRYILPNLKARYVWGINFENQKNFEIVTLENDSIICVDRDSKNIYVPNIEKLSIKGLHNVYNAAFVCGVLYKLDILPDDQIVNAFYSFAGLEHRIQFVGSVKNIDYINDSKSTSPDATIKALEALGKSKNIILISGGADKDITYESMKSTWQNFVKAVVFLPGNANVKLKKLASESEVKIIGEVQTMMEAVIDAQSFAQAGDIVLLSPSTASFTSFKSFEDRGNQFIECVQKLQK